MYLIGNKKECYANGCPDNFEAGEDFVDGPIAYPTCVREEIEDGGTTGGDLTCDG